MILTTGAMLDLIGYYTDPVCRAMIAMCVPQEELGKVYALVATVEAIEPLFTGVNKLPNKCTRVRERLLKNCLLGKNYSKLTCRRQVFFFSSSIRSIASQPSLIKKDILKVSTFMEPLKCGKHDISLQKHCANLKILNCEVLQQRQYCKILPNKTPIGKNLSILPIK